MPIKTANNFGQAGIRAGAGEPNITLRRKSPSPYTLWQYRKNLFPTVIMFPVSLTSCVFAHTTTCEAGHELSLSKARRLNRSTRATCLTEHSKHTRIYQPTRSRLPARLERLFLWVICGSAGARSPAPRRPRRREFIATSDAAQYTGVHQWLYLSTFPFTTSK